MTDSARVRRLLEALAAHPVLPPADALPADGGTVRALLADVARGERSSHSESLRQVAAERAIPPDELSRRARFLLACLVLPASGTHYEVLGAAPDATPGEIRARWASLIHLYHPDHTGGGWLDGQARRLIEAYQTLKDPDRRREYDARLARVSQAGPVPSEGRHPGPAGWRPGRTRGRWAPAGIVAAGVAVAAGAVLYSAPTPLPVAPLPPPPRLLGTWGKADRGEPRPQPPRGPEQPVTAGVSPGRAPETAPPADSVAVAPESTEPLEPPAQRGSRERQGVSTRPASPPVPLPPLPPLPPGGRRQGEGDSTERGALRAASAESPAPPSAPAPNAAARPVALAAPPAPGPLPPGASEATVESSLSPPGAAPGRGAEASPPAAEDSAWREVLALVEAFRSAYERKDLAAVMGLFGTEPRERHAAGRRAIEQLYARNFAALDDIRYELTPLDVATAAPDEGLVMQGRFRLRASRSGRPPQSVEVRGPVRWTLRRDAGSLRIVGIDYEGAGR